MVSHTVNFDPHKQVELMFERENFPVVMSPWEQESMVRIILDDLVQCGQASADKITKLRFACRNLQRKWRSLWAQFGADEDGWPHYRKALDRFQSSLKSFEEGLPLTSGMEAHSLIVQMVVRSALNPDALSERRSKNPPSDAAFTRSNRARQTAAKPISAADRDGDVSPSVATTRLAAGKSTIERPLIIVSAPRSGSTLLFETLARSPDLWSIGGESHGVFEQFPQLGPAHRDYGLPRKSGGRM